MFSACSFLKHSGTRRIFTVTHVLSGNTDSLRRQHGNGMHLPRGRTYHFQTETVDLTADITPTVAHFDFVAQTLNFVLDGSGADFMTLRYGNGNPFAFLLESTPALYYLLLGGLAIGGTALVIAVTIGIRALVERRRKKMTK